MKIISRIEQMDPEQKNLNQKDLDQIMEIWIHTNQSAHSFIPAEYWENHREEVRQAILEAEVCVIREKETDEIFGFIGLTGNYIAGLFVAEKYQSRGAGKKLINCVKEKKESLELHVYAENQRAVRFYQREGFQILERQIQEETGKEEYRMGWKNDAGFGK